MIALIDYGAGNLFSVANGLGAIGATFRFVREPSELRDDDKILLPGVGHFGQMMSSLDKLNLRDALIGAAKDGRHLLGICLGMQAFFEWSEEAPGISGLGLLPGTVRSLPEHCRVPHMGWNSARFADGEANWFYFANSFIVPVTAATWATTDYFGEFSSAVRQGNLWGFQFHPEKSSRAGLELIARWCQDAG
jgi:imidazole glycerol phosphate synthase glutamine amidotransferase subunit